MQKRAFKEYSDVRRFRVPYMKALKAMVWADYPFDVIRYNLRKWGFFFPDKEGTKVQRTIYDKLYSKFELFHHEAMRLTNGNMDFTPAETRSEGLFPFYEWLRRNRERVKTESDNLSTEETIIQQVMSDVHFVPLRRAICIMAWKMLLSDEETKKAQNQKLKVQRYTPEYIGTILQTDPRAPASTWGPVHAEYFIRFFWDVASMRQRDWQDYANMERAGDNPHMVYLQPIFENADRSMVSWSDAPMLDLDDMLILDTVKAVQYQMMLNSGKDMSLKASRELAKTVAMKKKIEYDSSQIPQAPEENPLHDVDLVIQKAREEQAVAFANISEMDGDVSDPRDTSFTKGEYLDQE